ncbi:MAG: DUF6242 domain-containing protein [Paludibacteraceae bacterium]
MKLLNHKNIIFFISIIIVFVSCNLNSSDTTNVSDNATITAFYINDNDSSEDASSAVFTITTGYDVDSIYNVDSLPYKTRVDSLIPSITTYSTSGFIINDTLTYYLSVTKAIDFTKKVKITNVATDGTSKKDYVIDLRVHKVDPYLHIWEKTNSIISSSIFENQKAVFFKNKFYFYTGSEVGNYVYTSSDTRSWSNSNSVTGLPFGVSLQNIDTLNTTGNPQANTLYLISNKLLYVSSDGENWSLKATDNKYDFIATLCQYQNRLYAVGQEKTTYSYRIISSANGIDWEQTSNEFAQNFPISGFGVTTFKPKYGSNKIVVVGGYNASGEKLNTRWTTEDGYYWVNLQHQKSPLSPIADVALAYYGSKLLLIGGVNKENSILVDTLQLSNSLDEGLTWTVPDTAQNKIPTTFKRRKKASIILKRSEQALFIIGGVGAGINEPLSDVWKVKVNYYGFKPEEWSKY